MGESIALESLTSTSVSRENSSRPFPPSQLLTLITLALDLAIFLPARNKILDAGGDVFYGIGFYCTSAAVVVLLLGAICTFFSLFTDRKNKRRATGGMYSIVPQPATTIVMPQMQPSSSYGSGKW